MIMITKSDTQQRLTPEWIDSLKENEIFVFGCRRSGRHWEGAAKFALEHFGAIFGQSEGLQGQAYAIPTAGVDLTEIKASVERFTQFASEHPELDFLVTPVGCGMGCWLRIPADTRSPIPVISVHSAGDYWYRQ